MTNIMTNKGLDFVACKYFVCPKLGLIDEKGKELLLKDETINRAKDLAIEYFKKTYRRPHYSSARHLLPSFVYIASILEGDRVYQKDVAEVFGTTNVTITKWYRDIVDTIGLKIIREGVISDRREKMLAKYDTPIHPDFDLIDEGGKLLGSDYSVIKRAKDIAVRYFNNTWKRARYAPLTKSILPSLLYLASILEYDRRTQMEIAMKFNISESNISVWYKDITETLGMKIIYGKDRKVLRVIEEEDEEDSTMT